MDVQYAQHDSRSQPLVALIVLNHERRELLLESLRAARATTYSPCRLVVVDNGSTDGSADAVECEFPDIIVLRSPTNAGISARNGYSEISMRSSYCSWTTIHWSSRTRSRN
jgi:GT2 family glycosyltransferase